MRAVIVILAALAASPALACGDSPPAPVSPGDGDSGAGHIHGLGVDPADESLYIATHTGMFRVRPGERRAQRVGDRHQDTMGFTVVGPNRFLGSGHPDVRDDLPPLLGLISSDDAGRTWRPVSLLGEADFHVLRAAGTRVYGVDATTGRLMVSDDGGRTWAVRTPPAALVDLAADPSDPDVLVASGQDRLYLSRDAGRRWRPLASRAGLLAWTPGGLFLADGAGAVHESRDGGRTWRAAGEPGGRPAALTVYEGDLYVALHTNEVKVSGDGGRTWRTRLAGV